MNHVDRLTLPPLIPGGLALNLTPGDGYFVMFGAGLARGPRVAVAQVLLAGLGLGALAVARPSVIFRQAFMGNILDSEVSLAFLPQFLSLGLVFRLGGRVVSGVVAGIFAGLAIRLALMQRG